jgi:choline dehydrogenase
MTLEGAMAHFVIVGAGSAGCVLAARLTEDPSIEVTLIEAGGADTDPEIHIPAAQSALRKSHCDWDYMSQREPGLDGPFVYLPRGKVLGGPVRSMQ